MLNSEVLEYIDRSVLCWLATTSSDLQPNVSPKEIFCAINNTHLAIANIASPQSLKNIKSQSKVCVSFIDILIQKGFQLKGKATIIEEGDLNFEKIAQPLLLMTGGKYPFKQLFFIEVTSVKPILAPSYILFPETSMNERISAAKKNYGLDL